MNNKKYDAKLFKPEGKAPKPRGERVFIGHLCPECGRELQPRQRCPECGKTARAVYDYI